MGASLREDIERRSKGPVRAELERAAVDEGAIGKDHLVPVAGCHAWHWATHDSRFTDRRAFAKRKEGVTARMKSKGVTLMYAAGAVRALEIW